MKRKVIKDIACFVSIIFLVAAYFVVINVNSDINHLAAMTPTYMMCLVMSVFSLLWSMREANKVTSLNIAIVLATTLFCFLTVVFEALTIQNPEPSRGMELALDVFFWVGGTLMAGDLIYACVLDYSPKFCKRVD